MPASTKTIRRRIKSVASTKKITKAMELVAAAKMKKAINNTLATRPYSSVSYEIVSAISKKIDTELHPLLKTKAEVKKILLVLIMSDRGLCGGFNSRMNREVSDYINQLDNNQEIELITIGKKAADLAKKLNKPINASFVELSNNPAIDDMRPIIKIIVDEYLKEKYDQVVIGFTDFKSPITQVPKIQQLLPFQAIKGLAETEKNKKENPDESMMNEYTFEPSPKLVLDKMLPRLLETITFQALLESVASEHSSRMVAMKNATEAAADMINELTLTYNQLRQAGITQEIAEISSGKAALENA